MKLRPGLEIEDDVIKHARLIWARPCVSLLGFARTALQHQCCTKVRPTITALLLTKGNDWVVHESAGVYEFEVGSKFAQDYA